MKLTLLILTLALTGCTSDRSDWDPGYGGDPAKAELFKAGKDNE